jgi:hypothetical protein
MTNIPLPDQEPGPVEALLPWYVNGTLNAGDIRRVEQALAADPALVAQLEAIREEAAETIHLNETLGVPSSQAMHKLFAAIDAEPARAPRLGPSWSARIIGLFAGLSPRALASATAAIAVVLLLQAALIGHELLEHHGGYQTASYDASPKTGTFALVRFAPDARMADIDSLLGAYHATVVDGPKAGMFRVAIGDKPLSKQERDQLIAKLQSEKIIGFAAAAE